MKISFTKAPTFTKATIGAAVFAITYLATTSHLPSCSDTVAVLNSGGECIERQSLLHTASGWLALVSLVIGVLLLALKHRDSVLGRTAPPQQAYQGPRPSRASAFCTRCGTRLIPGDSFCQGCGAATGGNE